MDSKAFHICPFCQSPSPVAAPRCVRCDRALSGLPLPVYGSELDATPMRSAPADLTDLPLRDTIAATPRPEAAPVTVAAPAAAPVAGPARRRVSDRGRIGRTAKLAVAAGIVGAALLGGWLVRAQDRGEPRARAITAAPATTRPAPAAAAASPALSLPSPAVAAAAPVAARASASPLPRAKAAPSASAPRAAWPQREVISPAEPPPPVAAAAADDETPRPTVRRARRPAATPIYDEADVTTVHPDVSAAPVGVERARDDFGREASPPEPEAHAAALRARLERAQQRRDVLAQRVTELRAQTNVPVIRDVDEYQRLQQSLSAALDELDRADADVARLRRALRRRGE
jgi:hypothetical protein